MSEDIDLAPVAVGKSTAVLTDLLHELAEARRELDTKTDIERRMGEIAREDKNYQAWQEAIAARREQEQYVVSREVILREGALAAWHDDKLLPPGLTVKQYKMVNYDAGTVTEWCRTHMPMMLVLDVKRFERGVKEGIITGAPMVEIDEDTRVQIAADLSQYLQEKAPCGS